MYILKREKIMGDIKIRSMTKIKEIERNALIDFLEEEKEKEKDFIRKQDYQILISSIMGIESLIIEDRKIRVVFQEELRWRGESEAEILDNDALIQNLKKLKTKVKVVGTPF